eukprot:851311-Amphidinium_carterae.1
MLLPLLLKLGGQHMLLTRLVSYIIIEVEKPLRGVVLQDREVNFDEELYSSKSDGWEHPTVTELAKPEWQHVVGKRSRNGCCGVLSSAVGRFPLECVDRLAALERELNNDEDFIFVCTVG